MSSSAPLRKIASNYLWSHGEFLPHPLVEMDADGRVISVSTCEGVDSREGVEFYAGILLPAFVNAHCHLELSYLKGAIPEGTGFAGFARAMGEVRGQFSEDERRQTMLAADAKMWHEGIGGVGDIANGNTSFAVKAQSKIDYHTFVEVFGLRNNALAAQRELLYFPHTSLTPHSIYSVQDAPFRAICAEGTEPLSIHFMESPAEGELFLRRGELWSWYRKVGFECDFLTYGSPAERIVKSVPRNRSVILVHNCCVTQCDIDRIMNHFTAPVYWCLCPASNHYISRLQPPVELLRHNHLNICLGTDSLASSRSLSVLDLLRRLPHVPLAERIGWATDGGAKALGMNELGTVEEGKQCGLSVLSGLDYSTMSLTSGTQIRRLL
ncbi:MAG: amidohydrolase family protein [Alistipes sp.]